VSFPPHIFPLNVTVCPGNSGRPEFLGLIRGLTMRLIPLALCVSTFSPLLFLNFANGTSFTGLPLVRSDASQDTLAVSKSEGLELRSPRPHRCHFFEPGTPIHAFSFFIRSYFCFLIFSNCQETGRSLLPCIRAAAMCCLWFPLAYPTAHGELLLLGGSLVCSSYPPSPHPSE